MFGVASKLLRAARFVPAAFPLYKPPPPNFLCQSSSQPIRLFSANYGFNANPIAIQMINYAVALARSQKSDESYAQGLLVMEQCQSTQPDDNSKGLVFLAKSTLLSERGDFDGAIEVLQRIQDLTVSSMAIRVAATEALVGLHLELGQDEASSVLADVCLQLLDTIRLEIGNVSGTGVLDARAKALKGLVELVRGNVESSESLFHGIQEDIDCAGSAALSYGEFLHAMRNFPMAKNLYEKVIQRMSGDKDSSDPHNLTAGNMSSEEILLAATCGLGQLEAHLGNFADAEEILTQALTKTEKHFGSHHPKVGVVLTCIALMFRHKATSEHSSSLLIQEGLYRRALEMLKAPPLETKGADEKMHRRGIIALARGGYAEILCIQQNRKAEGERMKNWAESAWKNRRMSLSEALNLSETSSKVPVVDVRISRAL